MRKSSAGLLGAVVLAVALAAVVVSYSSPAPTVLDESADDAAVQVMHDLDSKMEEQAHHQLAQARRSDRLAKMHTKRSLSERQKRVVAAAKRKEAQLESEEVAAELAEKKANSALDSIVAKETALKIAKEKAKKQALKESSELDKEEARIQRLKDKEMQVAAHADAQKLRGHAIIKEVETAKEKAAAVEKEIAHLRLQSSELHDKATQALADAAKSADSAKELKQVAREHAKIAESLQSKMREVLKRKAAALKRFIHATKHAALLAQENAAANAQQLLQISAGNNAKSPATMMLSAKDDAEMAQSDAEEAKKQQMAAEGVELQGQPVTIGGGVKKAAQFKLPEDPRVLAAADKARVDEARRRVAAALASDPSLKKQSNAVILAAKQDAKIAAIAANKKVSALEAEVHAAREAQLAEHQEVQAMIKTLAGTEGKLTSLVASAHAAAAELKKERRLASAKQAVLEKELREAKERKTDTAASGAAEKFVQDAEMLMQDAASRRQALANDAAAAADAAANAPPAAPTADASAGGAAPAAPAAASAAAPAAAAATAATDSTAPSSPAAPSPAAADGGSAEKYSHTNADEFDPLQAFNDFLNGQTIDSADKAGAAAAEAGSASAPAAAAGSAASPADDSDIKTNVDKFFNSHVPTVGGGAAQPGSSGDVVTHADDLEPAARANADAMRAQRNARAAMDRSSRKAQLRLSNSNSNNDDERQRRLHLPDPRSVKMDGQSGVGMQDLSHSTNFNAANDFLDSVQPPAMPDDRSQYFADSIEYNAGPSDLFETGAETMSDITQDESPTADYSRSMYQNRMATANLKAYERSQQRAEDRRDAQIGDAGPTDTF